jgi:nicotinate-nucleotide adenylyltransferase
VTRIGLLGGTFDPIHDGHLALARAATAAMPLDRIWLMPASVPPHRPAPGASAAHRFAMAALAIQEHDDLACSDLELSNREPSYTSLTLDRLEARDIASRRVHFVIGADAFREIASWRDYPALLDRCHFVVISRPDFPVGTLRRELPELSDRMVDADAMPPDDTPRIVLVDAATPPISSTEIRRRLADRLPITGLVPRPVERHIERHRLYRAEAVQGTP